MKEDDDEEAKGHSMNVARYPAMPSLVALQQMRNRLHLANVGRKLMKWTALATGKELRRIAAVIGEEADSYAELWNDAFILLARCRYFYPNLNIIVSENVPAYPKTACIKTKTTTKSITGCRVLLYEVIDSGEDAYAHLAIDKGGQAVTEAKEHWQKLLRFVVRNVEMRSSFIIEEIAYKSATKKENVLKQIIIPRVINTITYILLELEELAREELYRIKMVKVKKGNIAAKKKAEEAKKKKAKEGLMKHDCAKKDGDDEDSDNKKDDTKNTKDKKQGPKKDGEISKKSSEERKPPRKHDCLKHDKDLISKSSKDSNKQTDLISKSSKDSSKPTGPQSKTPSAKSSTIGHCCSLDLMQKYKNLSIKIRPIERCCSVESISSAKSVQTKVTFKTDTGANTVGPGLKSFKEIIDDVMKKTEDCASKGVLCKKSTSIFLKSCENIKSEIENEERQKESNFQLEELKQDVKNLEITSMKLCEEGKLSCANLDNFIKSCTKFQEIIDPNYCETIKHEECDEMVHRMLSHLDEVLMLGNDGIPPSHVSSISTVDSNVSNNYSNSSDDSSVVINMVTDLDNKMEDVIRVMDKLKKSGLMTNSMENILRNLSEEIKE